MGIGEETEAEGVSLPGIGLLKKLGGLASNLPSEETLNRFLDSLPELTALVGKLPDETHLKALVAMGPYLSSMPTNDTLTRLVNVLPSLGDMPSETTLKEIASLKPLLEKLPSPEQMKEMAEKLEAVSQFMGALKGS